MAVSYSDVETVAPTVEPVTLPDVRRHLDLDDSDRDSEIQAWITLARRQVEHDARTALINRTRARKLHAFPTCAHIQLDTMGPLVSVSSIAYIDGAGDSQSLATSVYSVDTARRPGIIWLKYGQAWPATRDEPNAVTITYVCGHGSAASTVPEEAKQAIYLILRHRLDHPDQATAPTIARHLLHGYEYYCSMLSMASYP